MKNKVSDVITVIGMGLGDSCLCCLDTLIRIEDDDINVFNCRRCIFREELDAVVCPYRMMYTHGRRVLL